MTDTLMAEAESVLRKLKPETLKICLEKTEFALSVQDAVLAGLNKDKKEKEGSKRDSKD